MSFLKRSPQPAVDRDAVRPQTIGKPLPTRDVRTLVLAQRVIEESERQTVTSDGDINRPGDAVPPEVQEWARAVLGEEECTCSIHCRRRSSSE